MPPTRGQSRTPAPFEIAFEAGLAALASADWHRACALFREAATKEPTCAEAWAGLAKAAYWVPEEDTILEARERAYHLYPRVWSDEQGGRDGCLASRRLGRVKGPDRARQRLDSASEAPAGENRDAPESAWITMANARFLMITGADASAVRRMASRAAALARRFGKSDVEALGLAAEGHARLSTGDVQNAIKCLDEAAAVILSSECKDLTAAALTLCTLMGACERIRDFDRARQWCAAARQFSEDQGFPVVLSICRPHYAAVLMWRGHWPEAEEHLQIGSRELMEFMPPFAVGALALMGSLRWRQGRWQEAEAIFNQIKHEPPAQLGMAELAAGQGDFRSAIDILERHLRTVAEADKLERGPALELLVRCLAADGQLPRASTSMGELRELSASVRSQSLQAAAAFAEGALTVASSDLDLAQACLGDAVGLFERAGAPFESARARIALAETLAARQQLDAAVREAHIAHETLRRIGASTEADRAATLLATVNAKRKEAARKSPDGLTAREAEILALVAEGRSNQDIASALVLSVRTVERHISNIYQKLGLDGRTARAAAAVYAHRAK